MPVDVFEDSIFALEAHLPRPAITVAVSVNTAGADEDIDLHRFYRELYAICEEHSVDLTTTITGKWESGAAAREQLRLFPPPLREDDDIQMTFEANGRSATMTASEFDDMVERMEGQKT